MKVLMVSGDRHLLEPGTPAYERLQLQRAQVDWLDVFVWPQVHSWIKILTAAKENNYDVVTAQDPFWRGLLAWWAVRRTGARLNIQVHTDLEAQPFVRRILARIVLRHADSIRVVSEKIKIQVEHMGVHAPVRVLPVFIAIDQFRTIRRQSSGRPTILWMGRFEAEKDPLTAIGVLSRVRSTIIDARLVMLGTGGMEQELRQKAQGLPIEFPGWQDPRQYLKTADVVLSTSFHESWGASIVEALASGAPVVALDVGVAKEAGAIVVPKSELASAVIDVLRSSTRGVLKLQLPSAAEWATRWKETLV